VALAAALPAHAELGGSGVLRVRDGIAPSQQHTIDRAERSLATAFADPVPWTFFPQAGSLWRDLFLNNFVDLDPAADAIRDFDCTGYTYDGHRGHDALLRSFREQDIGVPVFAAADGTVLAAHDGEFDKNTTRGARPANFVAIDHGGGRVALYYHLRLGSVAVVPGQLVRAGQQLGLTASSGDSNAPHLHFQSEFNGTPYEPNAGACRSGSSNWASQIPIRRELYLAGFAFSTSAFDAGPALPYDDTPRTGTFVAGARRIYFRAEMRNLPAQSPYRLEIRRPDGSDAVDYARLFDTPAFYRWSWWWWYWDLNLSQTGRWQVVMTVNGTQVLSAPFDVVSSDALVVNRAPLAPAVALASLEENAVPRCEVTSDFVLADPDYDIVRYRYQWTVNGAPVRDVTSAALSDLIPAGTAPLGAAVACTVTASDGTLSALPAQASGVVGVGATPPPAVVCEVPRVVGLTLAAARAAAGSAHCALKVRSQAYSPRVKKGRVVSQAPAAGIVLTEGAAVGVVLSKGPKPRR
jgi:hypothetical protein